MKARVEIGFRPGVLDPEAQAIGRALGSLGFDSVREVRRTKVIELELDGSDAAGAEAAGEGDVRAAAGESGDRDVSDRDRWARSRLLSSYEHDFYSWTQQQSQAAAPRCRCSALNAPAGVDWANLAQEIWELGLSLELQLYHRYVVLLQHLLKWRYQHRLSGGSWRGTINEQRRRISRLLQEESRSEAEAARRVR